MTSYTSFDPLKNTGTLSNSNLTVTQNGSSTGAFGLLADAKKSGKYYYEMTWVSVGGSGQAVGFVPQTTTISNANYDHNQASLYSDDHIYTGGTDNGALGPSAIAAGNVIGIAADFDNKKVWMINVTQGGNWNGSGTANPATNTGGYALPTGTVSGDFAWVPFALLVNTSTQITANFGASTFAGTVPSGFTAGWTSVGTSIPRAEYQNQAQDTGSSSSTTITVSTGGTDRVLVLEITTCATSAVTVSSVTDTASLTWALRKRNAVNDGSFVQTLEVWWAEAPSQLTNDTITVNYGTSLTFAVSVMSVVGVGNPSSPWDSNGSLPATASNTGSSSTPSVSGVSTTSASAMLLQFINTRQASNPVTGSAYTVIGPVNAEPSAGGGRAYEALGYQSVSVAQSSITVSGGNSLTPWGIIADALAGPAPSNTWASTETPDTAVIVGYAGYPGVSGDIATTETPDTFAAVGHPAAVGTWSSIEQGDVFSAYLLQPITAHWASTETPDTFAGTGVGYGETLTWHSTETPDVFAAEGVAVQPVNGTFNVTETPDTFRALGPGVIVSSQRPIFFVT